MDDNDVSELADFLDGCCLPRDEKSLQSKLKDTVAIRRSIIAQNNNSYPKIFNFYLVDPKLVKFSERIVNKIFSKPNEFYSIYCQCFSSFSIFHLCSQK